MKKIFGVIVFWTICSSAFAAKDERFRFIALTRPPSADQIAYGIGYRCPDKSGMLSAAVYSWDDAGYETFITEFQGYLKEDGNFYSVVSTSPETVEFSTKIEKATVSIAPWWHRSTATLKLNGNLVFDSPIQTGELNPAFPDYNFTGVLRFFVSCP